MVIDWLFPSICKQVLKEATKFKFAACTSGQTMCRTLVCAGFCNALLGCLACARSTMLMRRSIAKHQHTAACVKPLTYLNLLAGQKKMKRAIGVHHAACQSHGQKQRQHDIVSGCSNVAELWVRRPTAPCAQAASELPPGKHAARLMHAVGARVSTPG